VATIKLEPIAGKLRRVLSSGALFPAGAVEAHRASLVEGAAPEKDPALSAAAADFLAHFIVVVKGASAVVKAPQFASVDRFEGQMDELFGCGGPPESPLYDSYSTMHVLCEIPTGIADETPMSVVARLSAGDSARAALAKLAEEAAASHLDLYRTQRAGAHEAALVHVRSGRSLTVQLSGPFLRDGDLFLGRVLRFHTGEHFIIESPYCLLASEEQWLEYFARAAPASPSTPRPYDERLLRRHLKFGPSPKFWPQYIFDAYAGDRNGIVLLAGVPDRVETLPHHEAFDP